MIVQRQSEHVVDWFVVFFPRPREGWFRFVPGRFGHVAAFGHAAANRTWVVFDFHREGLRLSLFPSGSAALESISAWCGNAAILKIRAKDTRRVWRLGFWCVPAISHLLGVRSALLPEALWRTLLKEGATVVQYGSVPIIFPAGGANGHGAGPAGAEA